MGGESGDRRGGVDQWPPGPVGEVEWRATSRGVGFWRQDRVLVAVSVKPVHGSAADTVGSAPSALHGLVLAAGGPVGPPVAPVTSSSSCGRNARTRSSASTMMLATGMSSDGDRRRVVWTRETRRSLRCR